MTTPTSHATAPAEKLRGSVAKPPRSSNRHRVGEAAMAYAAAAWFAGGPWSLADAEWFSPNRPAVRLLDTGDRLMLGDEEIASRHPARVVDRQGGRAHFSDARAVCRVALRGDHHKLYPTFAPSEAPQAA